MGSDRTDRATAVSGDTQGGPHETIREALRRVSRAFTDVGIDSPGGDARRLVAAAINGGSADLIREPDRVLTPGQLALLDGCVTRRLAREPVSRILGLREFYGRPFTVTPAVLDPRADTETLIEVALEIAGKVGWRNVPIRILDIGTGSGVLLLTLLAELPQATGFGLDISQDALACAQANARDLGLEGRAQFVVGDMRKGWPSGFDLVISNPPYIKSSDIAGLDPEVANFDPIVALDGGGDGLRFYRVILDGMYATRDAAPRPQWLVLEAGIDQAVDIIDYARKLYDAGHNLASILRCDLGGIERCVAIETRSHMQNENVLEPS